MEILIIFIFVALSVIALALACEPPSPQQRTDEIKRKNAQEKGSVMAEIDAATEAHKRQVFELVHQANKQMVEEQAAHARQYAQQMVEQAGKEI